MSNGAGIRDKVWAFIRIMNVRLRFVFLMVLTGLIAANWEDIANHWERWTRPKSASVAGEVATQEYYCPMHPSVVRAEPGNCPICGMPLTRREKGESPELPAGTIARVQLSPHRMQLGGVSTSEVAYRPLSRETRGVGTIEIDERRVARIAARTAGRIEKLHVNFTGERVAKGDPLAELYSPDLVSAQEEYLIALAARVKTSEGGLSPSSDDAKAVLDASRERLSRWGVGEDQIAALEREGKARATLTVRSPVSGTVTSKSVQAGQYVGEGTEMYTVSDLSSVWAVGSLYEDDAASVRVGQAVEVRAGRETSGPIRGTIAFVQPVVEQSTRTVRVRIDVPNADGALRPGTYVEIRILGGGEAEDRGDASGATSVAAGGAPRYACPMCPEIVSDHPDKCSKCGMDLLEVERAPEGEALAIPESAVIDTGTRKIVYLEREPGTFDAVEVKLGPRAGGDYPVLEGLAAGDRIVTSGAFLVDAEGRLNPAVASSYFGASGGPSTGKP